MRPKALDHEDKTQQWSFKVQVRGMEWYLIRSEYLRDSYFLMSESGEQAIDYISREATLRDVVEYIEVGLAEGFVS